MDLSNYHHILDDIVPRKFINCEITNLKCKVFDTFKNYCKNNNITKIIVSLSGGVDSMVIAYCAVHCGLDVIGGHMNYGNREETLEEQKFLEDWCKLYGIKFELLTFGELKRGEDSRDEYERETRKMRYNFYGELVEKYNATGIFLGHHSNDVAENLFCNVMHGRSLEDLSVIRSKSEVMGVTVYRPFRDLWKGDIIEFALVNMVPYFKDTTPDWSNRGKLRRQIFPMIECVFERALQRKLYGMAVQSDELGEILREMVVMPFVEKCRFYGNGLVMEVHDRERLQNMTFWVLVMREVMHGRGESMPKQKVMGVMVERLKIGREFKMDFKVGWKLYYRDGEVYIVREELVNFWKDLRGEYDAWRWMFRLYEGDNLEEMFFEGGMIDGKGRMFVNPKGARGRKLVKIRNPVGKWEIYLE